MFILPTADQVIDRLGDKMTSGLSAAVAGGRDDLTEFRVDKPHLVAALDERSLANVAHSFIWTRMKAELDDLDGLYFHDCEPYHEILLDWTRMRVKRHNRKGGTRSYPTQAALDFYGQVADVDLLGERQVNLIAGYVWEPDTRTIGEAVLSMTNGSAEVPEWMVALPAVGDDDTGTVAPLAPTGDGPSTPTIETAAYERNQSEGTQDG